MYRNEEYWGKPLPGFGDPEAELLVLGLAPAAHGGNRTGRVFTGDRSGDFLYRALFDAGFASQPESIRRDDGLSLRNCYVSAAVRCAPPDNKPTPQEQRSCRPYLLEELRILTRLRAVLALGRIAFDACLRAVRDEMALDHASASRRPSEKDAARAALPLGAFHFAHGASFELPAGFPRLFASYHPSQQNTQTGRLTPEMFRRVLDDIVAYLASPESGHADRSGAAAPASAQR